MPQGQETGILMEEGRWKKAEGRWKRVYLFLLFLFFPM